MRGVRMRRIVVGGASLLLLAQVCACGLNLLVSAPDGTGDDAGLDATFPVVDATVRTDAGRLDASKDTSIAQDAVSDAIADALADGDAARDADKDADAAMPVRRVFLSTGIYTVAQIGSLTGGDALCQTEATAANLGGTWHAILGQNQAYAAIITRLGKRMDPIYRVDNARVVDNISLLLTATPMLMNPIDVDAKGTTFTQGVAWTGISAGGASTGKSASHCLTWASVDANERGVWGKAVQTDFEFLMQNAKQGADTCDQKHRVYCIEE